MKPTMLADDAHGTPIMLMRKARITPEEMVKNVSVERQRDFADFNIEFDNYHSTHRKKTVTLAS